MKIFAIGLMDILLTCYKENQEISFTEFVNQGFAKFNCYGHTFFLLCKAIRKNKKYKYKYIYMYTQQ